MFRRVASSNAQTHIKSFSRKLFKKKMEEDASCSSKERRGADRSFSDEYIFEECISCRKLNFEEEYDDTQETLLIGHYERHPSFLMEEEAFPSVTTTKMLESLLELRRRDLILRNSIYSMERKIRSDVVKALTMVLEDRVCESTFSRVPFGHYVTNAREGLELSRYYLSKFRDGEEDSIKIVNFPGEWRWLMAVQIAYGIRTSRFDFVYVRDRRCQPLKKRKIRFEFDSRLRRLIEWKCFPDELNTVEKFFDYV